MDNREKVTIAKIEMYKLMNTSKRVDDLKELILKIRAGSLCNSPAVEHYSGTLSHNGSRQETQFASIDKLQRNIDGKMGELGYYHDQFKRLEAGYILEDRFIQLNTINAICHHYGIDKNRFMYLQKKALIEYYDSYIHKNN